MRTEQGLLRISVATTLFLAAFGIAFGLLAHSFSIVFDGVYMLVDASMSGLALLVSRLIAVSSVGGAPRGKLMDRFSMGFWHLEPMVLGLNGIMLVGASVYALINAVGSLMVGGRELEFGYAIAYSLVALAACILMAVLEMRANKSLRSDFVALDIKAWIMSAGITAALLIAFCIGFAVSGTGLDWIAPYVDPAVLALICVIIIPLPIGTIRQALSEILLVTPLSLKQQVDKVATEFAAKYGFVSHRAYVAKVGRGKQIELYFIVPQGWPAKRLEEWDAIRDEIGAAIGDEGPDRWLTIAFTTDLEWAT